MRWHNKLIQWAWVAHTQCSSDKIRFFIGLRNVRVLGFALIAITKLVAVWVSSSPLILILFNKASHTDLNWVRCSSCACWDSNLFLRLFITAFLYELLAVWLSLYLLWLNQSLISGVTIKCGIQRKFDLWIFFFKSSWPI